MWWAKAGFLVFFFGLFFPGGFIVAGLQSFHHAWHCCMNATIFAD
jgi:hypothetical protein